MDSSIILFSQQSFREWWKDKKLILHKHAANVLKYLHAKYLLSKLIKCDIPFLIHPLSALILQDNVVHQIPLYILIKPDRFNNSLSNQSTTFVMLCSLKLSWNLSCAKFTTVLRHLQMKRLLIRKSWTGLLIICSLDCETIWMWLAY